MKMQLSVNATATSDGPTGSEKKTTNVFWRIKEGLARSVASPLKKVVNDWRSTMSTPATKLDVYEACSASVAIISLLAVIAVMLGGI